MAEKANNTVVADAEDVKSSVVLDYGIKDISSKYISDKKPISSFASNDPIAESKTCVTTGYVPELSQKCWDDQKRWDSTKSGRLAIRLFSRGILGAAAFAFGGWYAGAGGGMAGYKEGMTFQEIGALEKKFLPFAAKIIDETAGKALKFLTQNENWLKFRPTKSNQSLGAEAVGITFDFFCASIGDALGRDIADLFDPNVKHDWQDTKGHIKPLEAVKSIAKSAFRYVTYNGGEDWAVCVPYALYLRFQRNIIDKISPGFGYDSDRSLNGGSFKVNDANKITGNYNIAGMLDLQGRFTAYNILTLMYREVYNHVGHLLDGKDSSLYGSIEERKEKRKEQGFFGKVGDLCKWVVRSIIKGTIIMTPAVPFFSMFRTPQSKYKGLFINPDDGSVLSYNSTNGKTEALHANSLYSYKDDLKDTNAPIFSQQYNYAEKNWTTLNNNIEHPFGADAASYKAAYNSPAVGNSIFNNAGAFQNEARYYASRIPEKFLSKEWLASNNLTPRDFGRAVNASFAYTPYMFAKAESARYIDHGKTDAALERMIDGACDFNFKEFKAGAGELVNAIRHKPFADPAREAYAENRVIQDTSPADQMTKSQKQDLQKHFIKKHPSAIKPAIKNELSWKDRTISARPATNDEQFVQTKSHVDQEEMREFLRTATPLTNSVH